MALTALVIYTHTCIAYGGDGSWGYRSQFHPRSIPLIAMNALAQTFFMGGFFLLSVSEVDFIATRPVLMHSFTPTSPEIKDV
jgi:hypothetical protein